MLSLQHVGNITFSFHQNAWTHSRLVIPASGLPGDTPVHLIAFGSGGYLALADQWAPQGRRGGLSFADDVPVPCEGGLAVIEVRGGHGSGMARGKHRNAGLETAPMAVNMTLLI